jgi:hypothetical protein
MTIARCGGHGDAEEATEAEPGGQGQARAGPVPRLDVPARNYPPLPDAGAAGDGSTQHWITENARSR